VHSDSFPPPVLCVPQPAPSALQLAWLRELGVEKPWLGGQGEAGAPEARRAASESPETARPQIQGEDARPAQAAAAGAVPGSAGPRQAGGQVPAAAQPPAPQGAGPAAAALRAAGRGRHLPGPGAGAPSPTGPSPAAAFGALREDRRLAVSEMDLDTLRGEVQACEHCGLCKGRRQAVFGTGAQPAAWMVVGEAPGEQEDRQGLPFVGRSGQLLDAMLASLGHSREKDVYIANVIKCRPPGNRNPKPEEIAACSPYLMRQIELLRPERILVLGRFAAQTLLQTEAPIGSLRGRVHVLRGNDGREIPLVVSYHPAYLLRSPHEKARAWQDLRLAATL